MQSLIRFLDKALVSPAVAVIATLRRRRPRPLPAAPAHWVVIKLVGMGDAVLMLPAIAALRAAGHRVTLVTTVRCGQIFSAPGVADAVIVFRRRQWIAHGRAILHALRSADGVLDFEQHIYWSAALTLLAPASAPRLGFATLGWGRNRAYTQTVAPGEEPRPMKEIFDDLARASGVAPQVQLLPLPVGRSSQSTAEAWLADEQLAPGTYALLAPGSGATVEFRRMAADTWADVAVGLPAHLNLVMVGTWVERPLIAAIEQRIAAVSSRRVHRQLQFGLESLAALMATAAVVIATDSGPMHLAAAMGAPVVGIFGPDTPKRYAPYRPATPLTTASVWLGLACSPCNNCWIYQEARCTNPERYACIRGLTAAHVLAPALTLLRTEPE